MKAPTEKQVIEMCDAVRECDDNLGRCSDHEGSDEGPTFRVWNLGPAKFKHHAEAVISWHQHAISVYRRLLKMNERRNQSQKKSSP